MPVKAIPDRCNSVSVYLVVPDSVEALAFYEKAFGTRTQSRMASPDNKTVHAEMKLGNSTIMLADENPRFGLKSPQSIGCCTASLHVYVEDVDAVFAQATAAGCQVMMPPSDMFWGDRLCRVSDPYGHQWGIATHKEDVSEEDQKQRLAAMMAQMAAGQKPHGEMC